MAKAGRKSKQFYVDEAMAAGGPEAVFELLTIKQKRFAEEYLVDFNASAACLRAGYESKYPNKQGSELMADPAIKIYMDHLIKERADKSIVQPDYVIRKVVRTIENAEQKGKYSAVLKGCELLARHLGMFIDRQEISGPDGEAIKIEQQTKEEAEQLVKALQNLANKKKDIELV